MRKKPDYSAHPAFQDGYQRGSTSARAWQNAKRTVLWRHATRTEFRNNSLANALRLREVQEDPTDAPAFSSGFVTAYTRAFALPRVE